LSNVEKAAQHFIETTLTQFGIESNKLKLRKKVEINGLLSVSFIQLYKEYEVLLSEIELRIRPDAKVMAFGIKYYDNIDINTNVLTNSQSIKDAAIEGLNFENKKPQIQASGKRYILPIRSQGNLSYSFVEKVDINIDDNQKFASYVDLNSGELIWRRNLLINVETPVKIKGIIKKESHFSPDTEENFDNFFFTINGYRYETDESATKIIDIAKPSITTAKMEGRWAKVIYNDINNASFTDTIQPGEPFNILWDNSNSHKFERTLYYHANRAYEFFKMMDSTSKAMDFQLKVTIYNSGQPNAASDLENGNISFIGSSNPGAYFPETPSVLYHEYGHSINTRLYRELGIQEGMINQGCHEALADLNAALITDQPKIGYKAFPDTNKYIRNLINNHTYPQHVTGESHNDGLILAGAYWDLRLLTNLDYARWIVYNTRKLGTPDDEDIGTAFSEWFVETLITDDLWVGGDMDLSNGTPHAQEILQAFNNHKIGTDLALKLSFRHTPLTDTPDTVDSYLATFELKNPIPFAENQPENVQLIYSTNDFYDIEKIDATEIKDGQYTAIIPAQPRGTIVQYYIQAIDKSNGEKIVFSNSKIDFVPYSFLVGYKTTIELNLEDSSGWEMNISSDNATTGLWEIADPQGVSFYGSGSLVVFQPENDHSEIGTKCLVTGASRGTGQSGFIQYMPNGTTTAISPTFDISQTLNPILRFYNFFFNYPLYQFGNRPSQWKTYFSSDNGVNWVLVENTNEGNFEWTENTYLIEKYVSKSNQFKIKFEFIANNVNGTPTALSEGLVDDILILSANDAKVTGTDNYNFANNELIVYPNPTNDIIYIKNNCKYQINKVSLLSLKGELIISKNYDIPNSNIILNLTELSENQLSKGAYLLQIVTNHGINYKKIIIQ